MEETNYLLNVQGTLLLAASQRLPLLHAADETGTSTDIGSKSATDVVLLLHGCVMQINLNITVK